jgi:hypothetical protein
MISLHHLSRRGAKRQRKNPALIEINAHKNLSDHPGLELQHLALYGPDRQEEQ